MTASLDKLANNLHDTSKIMYDKCKSDKKLVNISSSCNLLLEGNICKTKKSKDLAGRALKKNFNHTGTSTVIKYFT